MRARINKRIDVQSVIDSIEHRVRVYTECVKDVMLTENVDYKSAKAILNRNLKTKLIFKTL
jgi:hypothetical protein